MAASAFILYPNAIHKIGNGDIDLAADTFKAVLCSSASNAATLTIDNYADLTNELATASGYTNGGLTLTTVGWTESGGVCKFDCDDITWNASGGSITARFMVIYSDTSASNVLLGYVLLDTTPADVTATAGNPFTYQVNASGLFTSP